eukprot:Skav218149  [mRNA]  locus=scaffold4089:71610:72319:- [translate_table: standard]
MHWAFQTQGHLFLVLDYCSGTYHEGLDMGGPQEPTTGDPMNPPELQRLKPYIDGCQQQVVEGTPTPPNSTLGWGFYGFLAQAAHPVLQFSGCDAVRIYLGGRGGAWRVHRYGSSSKHQPGAPHAGEA